MPCPADVTVTQGVVEDYDYCPHRAEALAKKPPFPPVVLEDEQHYSPQGVARYCEEVAQLQQKLSDELYQQADALAAQCRAAYSRDEALVPNKETT